MKTFKTIIIGSPVYILRSFKNNNSIWEYEIIKSHVTDYYRDEDDDNILNICITTVNNNTSVFPIWTEDATHTRAFLQLYNMCDEICEVFTTEEEAIQYVNEEYVSNILNIDNHIDKLNQKKIYYREALNRWEKEHC